jgi:AraC-like DNA-binding protein
VKCSKPDLAGSKTQQFAILQIDRLFEFYKPKLPLSKFVDNFWLYEGRGATSDTERILPTGTFELAINLRQNELQFSDSHQPAKPTRFSGAVVSGAHGHGFTPVSLEAETLIVGVHFKPGGAFPFLGLPAGELANTHFDLETLWGEAARRLRERLCEATTAAERFRLIEEILLRRLGDGVDHHYAVSAGLEMFAQNESGPCVREAARDLNLSQRRFIQIFKAEVGITPKLFSRIQRFQKTRAVLQQNPPSNWTMLALDSGYCDQSHFIREFLEFSGVSPTDYLSRYKRLAEPITNPQNSPP